MKNKIVCFAGHRHDWQNIGIEDKLKETIINLINKGYNIFYDGGKGYFDNISAKIVLNLKEKFPEIKIYKILTNYNHKKDKLELSAYDGSILPEIQEIHYKQKITKKNEWMINNCDILVCHIKETYKSGAYTTFKYAQKLNKEIILI